jgi:hypothetical protein
MMPQTNGKVSLRNVRSAAAESLNSLNQHARLLNTQILPNINFLKRDLDETKAKLAQTAERLDAFTGRDWRGRLRYLFLGR